jgi:hypothetical protein
MSQTQTVRSNANAVVHQSFGGTSGLHWRSPSMAVEFYFTPELHLRDGRVIRDLEDAISFALSWTDSPATQRASKSATIGAQTSSLLARGQLLSAAPCVGGCTPRPKSVAAVRIAGDLARGQRIRAAARRSSLRMMANR